MKKTFYFILIGLFSCQTERKPDEVLLEDDREYSEWNVYEGRIPLNENTHLYIELSVLPGDPDGEGSYRLKEFVETQNAYAPASRLMENIPLYMVTFPGK